MTTQEIKCAKCHVPLKGPADPKPQDRIECPRCGVGDKLDRVLAEVGEYVTDQVADSFDRTLETAFRNSKNVKLTKSPRARKMHRFIIDLKSR